MARAARHRCFPAAARGWPARLALEVRTRGTTVEEPHDRLEIGGRHAGQRSPVRIHAFPLLENHDPVRIVYCPQKSAGEAPGVVLDGADDATEEVRHCIAFPFPSAKLIDARDAHAPNGV